MCSIPSRSALALVFLGMTAARGNEILGPAGVRGRHSGFKSTRAGRGHRARRSGGSRLVRLGPGCGGDEGDAPVVRCPRESLTRARYRVIRALHFGDELEAAAVRLADDNAGTVAVAAGVRKPLPTRRPARSGCVPTSIVPNRLSTLTARAGLMVAIFSTAAGGILASVSTCSSRCTQKGVKNSPQLG